MLLCSTMHAHHGSLASPEGTASEERPRVLLAEDDPELRTLISLSLRWDGYVVVEAADGTEALECFGGSLLSTCAPRAFDLIVSDIRMPGFSGMDVLFALRGMSTAPPVILITAFGDYATHERAKRFGALEVLDKPFDLSDLRAAVSRALAHRGPSGALPDRA